MVSRMADGLERISKDAVMVYSKYYPILACETRKNLGHDGQYHGQDSIQASPLYVYSITAMPICPT
jgi:hypothetical protein